MGCGGGCGSGCGSEEGSGEPHEHGAYEEQKTIEMPDGKTIIITEEAIGKVKEIMQAEGKGGWGLRVEAIPGGCSGFLYNMEFEQKEREGDIIQEENGVKIFMDPMSKEMLFGATVGFVDGLHGQGFSFSNPNTKSSCGCGKSFG